jgi:hypothetical protein
MPYIIAGQSLTHSVIINFNSTPPSVTPSHPTLPTFISEWWDFVGPLHSSEGQQRFGSCSSDGIIRLLKSPSEEIWQLHTGIEFQSIFALDVNNDGEDEIVACGWDGTTFIVDEKKRAVKFRFEETIASFVAGKYGLEGQNSPCFCYVTNENKLVLVLNASVETQPPMTIFDVMASESNALLPYLNSETPKLETKATLFASCLNLDFDTSAVAEYRTFLQKKVANLQREYEGLRKYNTMVNVRSSRSSSMDDFSAFAENAVNSTTQQ